MAEQKVTFCRICEALCGLVATVENGRIVQVRPDPDHPLSRGYACPKGIAMVDVQNDPDRVLYPLRRRSGGSGFERLTWDDALQDIGRRLGALRHRFGPTAIGWYMGNPAAFSYAHAVWVKGFMDALGSPHHYTAGSQDVNNRFAASALLYGSPLRIPIPDLRRTRLLLMVGANPLVSHGSLLSAPRIKDELDAIVARGGRVVVVDPRRSETARAYEHLPINADTDAWFLLSLLAVVFAERLDDREAIARWTTGSDALRTAVAAHPPEATEGRTGVPAETVRRLARSLASAGGAAVYGRTGSCLGRFGTLVAFLLDALNIVTGNLDRPGGAVFGHSAVRLEAIADRLGKASYARRRSRLGNFPDVLGSLPASLMAAEIETPGPHQLRALFISAGNPVLSVPNGRALEKALDQLDLCVSLDLYVNETNQHADYILPAATFLERHDVAVASLSFYPTPFVQYTDPVVPPAGEAREEWEVIEALARPLGIVPSAVPGLRLLGRLGLRITPQRVLALLLRLGPDGDWFGLRRGLSIARLRRAPHGVVLRDYVETGILRRQLRHRDRRIHLNPPEIAGELGRLQAAGSADPAFPLRLIGLRELRSHNSWMHNAPLLMRGGRSQALRVHPDDARAQGLQDGERVRVRSKSGVIEVVAAITDEMKPGTVALPHGWGHQGGWRLANAHAGANGNLLASSDPADLETLAGMALLNGIPVRLEAIEPTSAALQPPDVKAGGIT